MAWWDGSGEMPEIDQQVLSTPETTWNWDFPQAASGPVFEWGNQGQLGGMPIGGLPPDFSVPQFGGMGVRSGAPMGVPSGTPSGMPPGLSSPPSPMATAGAPAQTAMGPLGGPSGRGDSAADAPPKAGMGAAAGPRPAQYQPGAQSQPFKEGGFDWKKMLSGIGGQVAGAGTQALIGGGMNLLGQALAPKPKQQGGRDGGAPASAPAPPPQTPTGTPNMGAPTPPTPGAQWSPLLMQRPGIAGPGGAVGLEAQRRMRRGGQTGGMALY